MALRLIFGRMLFIRYALDDWYFARDFIHRVRPGIEERLDRFAAELVRIARETDADEVIVDGHSLGAPLSLIVVDRALKLDPELSRRGRPLHFVSSGSSLLKVALHPAAGWLREAVARVANAPIYWVEFQALVDIINVYKVDPVVALGLAATGKPIIQIIRIRSMVEETTYRGFHLNFLRIHRQAMMGNERRYYYDYYMLCCGPIPLAERVADGDAAVAAFTAEGALTASVARGGVGRRDGARAVTATISKFVWLGFCLLWSVLRQRPGRRSRKTAVRYSGRDIREIVLLGCSLTGLGIVPFIYVVTGFPRFANYPFTPVQAYLGIAVFVGGPVAVLPHASRPRRQLVGQSRSARTPYPGHNRRLRPRTPSDVHGLLADGARPGPAAAELDRRAGRVRRVWRALLRRVGREERMMINAFGEEYRLVYATDRARRALDLLTVGRPAAWHFCYRFAYVVLRGAFRREYGIDRTGDAGSIP